MKKTTIYLAALVLTGIIGSAGLASAFGFGFHGMGKSSAAMQAIQNNDFAAWRTAMTETLTQENFDKFAGKHSKMPERMGMTSTVMQALSGKNYTAYLESMANTTKLDKAMSEEEFNAMAERHNAMHSGKKFGHMGGSGMGMACARRQ